MSYNKPILDLVLQRKWFVQIDLGIKKQEYRSISDHWQKRLKVCQGSEPLISIKGKLYNPKKVLIRFRNGYNSNSPTMLVECKGLNIGKGNECWGAPEYDNVFMIDLGHVVERNYQMSMLDLAKNLLELPNGHKYLDLSSRILLYSKTKPGNWRTKIKHHLMMQSDFGELVKQFDSITN